MKSKNNIKILFSLVIIIWGLLIYKIVDAFSDANLNTKQSLVANFKAPNVTEKEKFKMLPIEADPFLGTLYTQKKKTSGRTSMKPKNEVVWPTIEYRGIVSDNNSKTKVFIITINGQQQLLSQGENVEGLKLVKGDNESVTLRFKEQTQVYSLM